MRLAHLLKAALTLTVLAVSASTSSAPNAVEPDIFAAATFLEENTFNHVVNGEKNAMIVTVENRSDRNVTLLTVSGSLNHPDSNVLLANLTSLKYGVPLIEKSKIQLPYAFYSEFKPGEHRLNIWLDHLDQEGQYRVNAFEGIVTIVEPAISIYDFKMVTTYLIVAVLLGGLAYMVFMSFVPQKKSRARKTSGPAVGAATATGAGGYQEEWIPEHHLKKGRAGKKRESGVASGTSGDELSGAETSGGKKQGKYKT